MSVQHHFLDSGAFSQTKLANQYAKDTGRSALEYYDTDQFWAFMEAYVSLVKKYQIAIDFHANVDVIGNATLSYRNLKWLEQRGLRPVPVVHFGTPVSWLTKYVEEGYEYIGLGGLVGKAKQQACRRWVDIMFDSICCPTSRLPTIKLHGFGVTHYPMLIRWPWYSVDSASWCKVAAYGGILVPHKRGMGFTFDEDPYIIKLSKDSPARKEKLKHIDTMRPAEKKIVHEWLEDIGIDFASACDKYPERYAANIAFFERLRKWLPEWPWPFQTTPRRGFGLL